MNKFPPNVHNVHRLRYLGDISQALEKPSRNFTQVGEAPTRKILSHHKEFYAMYTPSLNSRSFILKLKLNLIIHFSSHFYSLLLPLQTHPAVFLNASIWLRTVWSKPMLFLCSVDVCWRPQKKRLETSPSPSPSRSNKEPPKFKSKFCTWWRFKQILFVESYKLLPRAHSSILFLETRLWQCAMSSSLKSPWEGLTNAECKKGTPPVRLPIPYVPPTKLHEKQETEQIKVELLDRTKFQMPTYSSENNK